MNNPIDSLRQLYTAHIQPLQADARDLASDVGDNVSAFLDDAGEAGATVWDAVVQGGEHVATAVANEGVLDVARDVARENLGVVREIVQQAQQQPDGQAFMHWLVGPDGPSIADATSRIPGLQDALGDVMDASMSNPMITGAIGQAFGFEYHAEGDFYTTNEGSIQSNFGFHSVYDLAGDALGMDLTEQVVEFEYGGVEYKLETWQGSYGGGGAFGGEIGLYTRNTGERGGMGDLLEGLNDGYYSAAAGDDQIEMSQTIYNVDTGEEYFTNPGVGADDNAHYWNLAIRTDPGVNHEDIGQRGELVMQDPGLAQAMYDAMVAEGMDAQIEGSTIRYDWP